VQRRFSRIRWLGIVTALACCLLTGINAFAHTNTLSCSSNCYSLYWWNGTTYGGATKFTISNPTISNKIGYWIRLLRLQPNNDNLSLVNPYPRVDIGISKTKGGAWGAYCGGYGDGLHFFVYAWDINGDIIDATCQNVPSTDVNTDAYIQVLAAYDCYGEGDGLVDEMYATFTSGHYNNTFCVDTEAAWYTREVLFEQVVDNVSNHYVWGSHWVLTEWANANYQWSYQSRGEDGYVLGNPPQMYWHTVPASGNHGGELYSCVYETGSTCTYGG
jgi:hypothetical protein